MNPQPTPTLHDLRWKFLQAASNGTPFPSQTIQVATLQELENAAADMLQTQKALRENHKEVKFGGAEGKYVQLSHDGYILRVTISKPAKHTNVAQTSKEAYRSIDLGDKCKEMAEAAIRLQDVIGYCTDLEIERTTSMRIKSNLVSARRADIVKAGGIRMDDGSVYRIEMTDETVKDRVTGRRAMVWKIVPVKQPADEGAQISLFNA